jgi:hypothetical protein
VSDTTTMVLYKIGSEHDGMEMNFNVDVGDTHATYRDISSTRTFPR